MMGRVAKFLRFGQRRQDNERRRIERARMILSTDDEAFGLCRSPAGRQVRELWLSTGVVSRNTARRSVVMALEQSSKRRKLELVTLH